jgi:uncharacterized protein (TIGR03083 family)
MADDTVARAHRMIAALRHAQDRLATLVASLPIDALDAPSYDAEWKIADVLSHIGSGADIFGSFLDAGLAGQDAPGMDSFPVVWERWNAKPSGPRATDAVSANEGFVVRMEAMTHEQLASLALSMFGMDVNAPDLARMRLSELAVHTWDVAVALDPAARIDPEPVALLMYTLPALTERTARPDARPARLHVRTTAPDDDSLLVVGETAELGPWTGQAVDGTIELPAEAFLRLVYGRLDAEHTPTAEVTTDGAVDLPALRAAFPGF